MKGLKEIDSKEVGGFFSCPLYLENVFNSWHIIIVLYLAQTGKPWR